MKKTIIASLLAALVSTSTLAANGVLQNEYIKAGVNEITGTLGSGGSTSPGLLYNNAGSSTWNAGYDYLTPGSPFEGFTVRLEQADSTLIQSYTNNNAGNMNNVTGAWVGTPSSSSAVWAGSTADFNLQHTYSLPSAQKYIDINTRIESLIAVPKLWFGRFIDPDAVAAAGDTSATDNVLGYGAISRNNVVFSEANVSRYALGLYSAASNVRAGITRWSTNPVDYYANNANGYGSYTDNTYGNGDDTIGLGFLVSGVGVGDIVTFRYAYIFGPSAFGAADSAVTGGAGGGTPGTVPGGGTLTDVGSATDSAIAGPTTPAPPPAPTVTGTSTAIITVSDVTAISSTLPVITASLAHHEASEGNGKQTIARETTTNVTTPMERTVVTKIRTTTTWSDSTTTTSDSATSTTTEVSNVVDTSVANDSFSGRIDQMNYLGNLNKELDRSLNMDAFRQDGTKRDDVTVYINASGSKSNMNNGYNAKNQIYGIGIENAITNDWRLGVQYNRVTTTMNGVDSTTAQDKNHFGLFSILDVEGFKIVNNLGYADNTVKSNRTIQGIDFNNSHSTKGTDLWLNNRVYTPDLEGFRPFVGVTVGKSTVDGYQEAGSIQSARTVAGTTNNYTYGEGGVRYEKSIDDFRLMGEVGQSTDSFTTGSVTIGYKPTKDGMIAVTGTTQTGNNVTTNTVSLRGIIRF
jgi:hypothetical protein